MITATKRINKLKKGKSLKVSLLEIKTKKKDSNRVYNAFFDGTIEEARVKGTWINERIVLSCEEKEIEVRRDDVAHDFINEEGFLDTICLQSNPNDDEDYKILPSDAEEMAGNYDNAEFLREIGL